MDDGIEMGRDVGVAGIAGLDDVGFRMDKRWVRLNAAYAPQLGIYHPSKVGQLPQDTSSTASQVGK